MDVSKAPSPKEVAERLQKTTDKLKNILEGRPESPVTCVEFMANYNAVYNYTTTLNRAGGSELMYDTYRKELQRYIDSAVAPALEETHGELMLRALARRWRDYKTMLRWLYRVFHYLDRYFAPRKKLPSLNQAGLFLFRDEVYTRVRDGAAAAVLSLIKQEREGAQVDRALLKSVVELFVEMGEGRMEFYETDLEAAVLDDTAGYYALKASRWMEEETCPEYMAKAEECLRKERDRAAHYLQASTEEKLLERARRELLVATEERLLEMEDSGCLALFRGDKVDDLSRMYRLFSMVPHGLDPIAWTFKQHVSDEGMALVRQAEVDGGRKKMEKEAPNSEAAFVRKVIELHDKHLGNVVGCFQNHTVFHKALREAFELICNKEVGGTASAELLADFCDGVIRKVGGFGGIGRDRSGEDDSDADETLEKVVRLLAYLRDKDIFAEFCRKKLARRLLFERGGGDHDLEGAFLMKLKRQCGRQLTSKMEGMVTDITLARENAAQFEEFVDGRKPGGVDLTVTVLTIGLWPSYRSFDLNLPAEMVRCVEAYREFYQGRTRHRKLTWVYSLGTCNVVGKFDARPVELVVSTHQAAALLLFNNSSDGLTYSEIVQQLNLTNEDAARTLHSLSCGKYRILKRVGGGGGRIGPGDAFEVNGKFTDRMRRIRIPLPQAAEERKKVMERVDMDRRFAIDAAVVRIMKSRKVMGYQQLVAECVEQLRHIFRPEIKAIKKRVEDLVTRDYLERDEANGSTLTYLA